TQGRTSPGRGPLRWQGREISGKPARSRAAIKSEPAAEGRDPPRQDAPHQRREPAGRDGA
ncbi:unnamed protein product, partial [Phaeothamnion confervicola]